MELTDIILQTDRVPILDYMGVQIDEVALPERITPVPRRRCGISENHIYYKGAGIIYQGHYVNKPDASMICIAENPVAYQRYSVAYPCLYQKYGIFTFCHQPVFSDYEGGCGPKEQNLLRMQKKFMRTAIDEIVDVMDVPLEGHQIYAFRLKQMQGSYKETIALIEYILCENFNSAWDKNLWADIMCYGYVRDLADWFISDSPTHKLGTIYGLLRSIMKADKYLYEDIVRETVGLEQLGDIYMPYIAAKIVERYIPGSLGGLSLEHITPELIGELWKIIYSGKACCHLEKEEEWAHIREDFLRELPRQTAMVRQEMKIKGGMDDMGINGIAAGGYPAWRETRKVQDSEKTDFGEKVREVSGAKNVVHIDPDAIFSIHHVKTGESANVYRADDYSKDNPVYLVKGIDRNGNEYEQTIDINKVNPNSCSYTEMLALNAHTGDKSDSNFMTMSILKDKVDNISYHEKADWMSIAHELMNDMTKAGSWDSYLRYDKWINDILTFCKSKS